MSHAEVVQIRNPMKVPVLVFNKPLVERGLDANSEASAAALRTAQEHRHGQSQGCVPFCIHVVACKPLQRCWCTGGGGCAPRNSHFLFISFYDARGNRGVSSQTREKIGELIHFQTRTYTSRTHSFRHSFCEASLEAHLQSREDGQAVVEHICSND